MERDLGVELQRELKLIQVEGSKRTVNLWGMIRKIRSINSVMMMKRDEAKKRLDTYVNKLSQCLIDFRCEMETTMDKILSEKQDELSLLKKRYEDDLETLLMLCTETDKMIDIWKNLNHPAEQAEAKSLLEAFTIFLSRETKDCSTCTKNLSLFDVKTALELEEITPQTYGQMSVCASGKGDQGQTGFRKLGQVTDTLDNVPKAVRIERCEPGCQEMGTQTMSMCADQGIQTEDHVTYPQPLQVSPTYPLFSTMPDAQTLSPVHMMNNPSTIPVLSPILVYDPSIIGGGMSLGVNCNSMVPLLQETQQTSIPQTQYDDAPSNQNKNRNNMLDNETVRGSSCPPGFTAADASPTSRSINWDRSSPISNDASPTSRSINWDRSSPISNDSPPCKPSTGDQGNGGSMTNNTSCPSSGEKTRHGRAVSLKGQALDDYLKAQYDRSTVYVPPPAPAFVKDLKQKFDGMGSRVERKPLRKPFSHTAEMKVESNLGGYSHSTPIKGTQKTDCEKSNTSNELTKRVDDFDKTDENDNFLTSKQETSFPAKGKLEMDQRDFVEIPNFESRMTLSDYMKENYPPSVQDMNQQTLKAQTSWCKGYLSQFLKQKDKSETKECSDNSKFSTGIPDMGGSNITEFDRIDTKDADLDPDMTKRSLTETHSIPEKEISVDGSSLTHKDDSGISISDKSKPEQYNQFERETESGDLSQQKENKSGLIHDQSLNMFKVKETYLPPLPKGEHPTIEEWPTDEGTASAQEQNSVKVSETSKKCPVNDAETAAEKEKRSNIQNQTQNLNKAVKQFLGDTKHSKPKARRLGALQAHWLKNCQGSGYYADKDAKFVFKLKGNFHFPIGVASNSENQIIVADTGNHVLKMFDETGQHICEFGAELPVPMRRPSAIVVNESDDMFVKDDICIRVFNKKGHFITDFGKTAFKRAFGLAMTTTKNLLVLDTHRSNPSLVHLSQDGKEVHHFLFTPLVNADPMSKCRFLGVSDNNVIVSDLGISQIYITTLEGVYLTRVGMYGNGPLQFFEPSGVSVDIYGNFVIGDSKNNRIQIYRYDGTFTGLLNVDEPNIRPSGLHLTSDNRLLVVNFLDHCIKVFQL